MKSLFRLSLLALTLLTLSFRAAAAIPKVEVRPSPILKGAGVVMGGKAGPVLALMDIRRSESKKSKTERLVLDFGSGNLKPVNGQVGYYHAELQTQPARLILELPQTMGSALSEEQILSRFKKSLYVEKALVQFDRNLQSMTMVLQLKKAIQVRVTPVKNAKAPGKLVVDMMPL